MLGIDLDLVYTTSGHYDINISQNNKSIASHNVKDVLVLLSMKDLGSKSDKEKGLIALKLHK